MKKVLLILAGLLILFVVNYVKPVYEFYAHKGDAPFPPWGMLTIPEYIPEDTNLANAEYESAGSNALQALKKHRSNINTPGISAAVGVNGKVVWAGAVGWADIATEKPMTTSSQLRIGSTSKALTSGLLAQMVQQGALSLDTKVGDLAIGKRNDHWQDITPRQLASHMAGLPHYKDNTEFAGLYQSISLQNHYENVNDAVALFDESDLLFSPGEDFSYSSYGTVLLSAVLQEVGQAPYQQLMQEQVFDPLGMTNTRSGEQPENNHKDMNLASFYWRLDESQNQVREWREVDLSHRLAGGGLISTSSDLVKLGLGFLNPDFVKPDVQQQFWTPQQLNDGQVNEQNYAIGWRVYEQDFGQEFGTFTVAHHGGVSRGAQSWLMVIPEVEMVIAVNINTKTNTFSDFARVSFPIAQTFLKSMNKETDSYDDAKPND